MNEHHDPPRLRDDAELRAFLESAELDEDGKAVHRIGMALGLAPSAPTLPTSAADVMQASASGWTSTWSVWKTTVLLSMFVGLGLLVVWRPATDARDAQSPRMERTRVHEAPLEAAREADIADAPREESPPRVEPSLVSSPIESDDRTSVTPAPRDTRANRERRAPREIDTGERTIETSEAASLEPTDSAGSLAAEVRLIERIRTTLATDPESALQLAESHRVQFPNGRLRTERERLERRALASRTEELP